jgi:hypothetical protein
MTNCFWNLIVIWLLFATRFCTSSDDLVNNGFRFVLNPYSEDTFKLGGWNPRPKAGEGYWNVLDAFESLPIKSNDKVLSYVHYTIQYD